MNDPPGRAASSTDPGRIPDASFRRLGADGLRRFRALHGMAVAMVGDRLRPGRGDELREELALHLEFLEPALEFGLLHPIVDYLTWAANVHSVRSRSLRQLQDSVQGLAEFFVDCMDRPDGLLIADTLRAAQVVALGSTGTTAARWPVPEPWPAVARMTTALLAGSRRDAIALVNDGLDAGQDLADFEFHVIQPALYEIGRRWEAAEATVADEHAATAIARCAMMAGLLRCVEPAADDRRIVLACVDGNRHDVGLQMVSDAFALAGWQVLCLGADVPAPETVQCAIAWRADLVGLSVAFAQQMRSVREITDRLRETVDGAGPPVLVGGLAANRYPWLAHAMGANAIASNSRDAVEMANSLVAARNF
jgi:methanogenic corrinoid protein MtbC1